MAKVRLWQLCPSQSVLASFSENGWQISIGTRGKFRRNTQYWCREVIQSWYSALEGGDAASVDAVTLSRR